MRFALQYGIQLEAHYGKLQNNFFILIPVTLKNMAPSALPEPPPEDTYFQDLPKQPYSNSDQPWSLPQQTPLYSSYPPVELLDTVQLEKLPYGTDQGLPPIVQQQQPQNMPAPLPPQHTEQPSALQPQAMYPPMEAPPGW